MDKIENYFKDADAVLIGNGKKPISGNAFESIKKHIKSIEEETGLIIIIAEFNIDYGNVSMTPVTSSQISSVGYDKSKETLYVHFCFGTVYSYSNVPVAVYNAMLSAESVGKFLSSEVKGKYDYLKTDKIVVNGELKP